MHQVMSDQSARPARTKVCSLARPNMSRCGACRMDVMGVSVAGGGRKNEVQPSGKPEGRQCCRLSSYKWRMENGAKGISYVVLCRTVCGMIRASMQRRRVMGGAQWRRALRRRKSRGRRVRGKASSVTAVAGRAVLRRAEPESSVGLMPRLLPGRDTAETGSLPGASSYGPGASASGCLGSELGTPTPGCLAAPQLLRAPSRCLSSGGVSIHCCPMRGLSGSLPLPLPPPPPKRSLTTCFRTGSQPAGRIPQSTAVRVVCMA